MNKYSGFTLIELLVVISIIGILAAFSYVSFLNSQLAARDTQRRSDLNQYKIALEQYANNHNGAYPVGLSPNPFLTSTTTPAFCTLLGMTSSQCLGDPTPTVSGFGYYYTFDAIGTVYKLYAKMESAGTNKYWVVCSSGKSGVSTTTSISSDPDTCEAE